jgi:hypothetical protein
MHGIYIGWLGEKNLGDDAMFQVCREVLPQVAWSGIDRIYRTPKGWAQRLTQWRHHLARRMGREVGLLGGGTILNRNESWIRYYELTRERVQRPVPVFSPGVAHPEFWSRIDGWESTLPQWRDLLGELPVVGVRGPRSKALLDDAGFADVMVTGDPALALYEGPAPVPPPGRRSVAFNVGRSGGLMWGDEDTALREIAAAAALLRTDGWDVRFVPVWEQDEPVCVEAAVAAGLGAGHVLPLELDARVFVRSLHAFDVVVGMKLHASVLAAAAGVPFVPLEYRPKVRDFAESIGWGEEVIRTSDVSAAALADCVRRLHVDGALYRARLDSAVARSANALADYTRRLEPMLS